jgi:hypothetical protein
VSSIIFCISSKLCRENNNIWLFVECQTIYLLWFFFWRAKDPFLCNHVLNCNGLGQLFCSLTRNNTFQLVVWSLSLVKRFTRFFNDL